VALDRLHGGPDTAPKTPTVRSAPAKPGRSIDYMGAPTWPPNPHRSQRPGEAGALSSFRVAADC